MTAVATEGERLRDEGQARAADAVADWSAAAREVIEALAERGRPFTSEDVVRLIGLPCPSEPNRNNAVGAAMGAAARRRIIRRVDDRNATRPLLHARRLSVWEGVKP